MEVKLENNAKPDLPVQVYGVSEERLFLKDIFRKTLKDLSSAHSLGFLFAQRNIKAKYRQSILGFFWAFLPPLATALIWIVLNKTNVVRLESPGVPYPLFVITGTILWTVFSSALIIPMQTVQSNRGILVKVNFPRESLLISALYEVLFNAALSSIIILGALLFFNVSFGLNVFLFIPGILMLILIGMSIGIILLPIAMLYKDVQFALPTLLQFFMYLTPVVYPLPSNTTGGWMVILNPITPILTNTREALLDLPLTFGFQPTALVLGGAIILLVVGVAALRATMQILIERMGS